MTTPGQYISGLEEYKPSVECAFCSVSDFWRDYEGGDPERFSFSVEVYGDFTDYREVSIPRSGGRSPSPSVSSAEELRVRLWDVVRLWSKDFVVMLRSDFLAVLKNRGLRYRLWRDSLRVWAVSRYISKRFELSKGLSNVVFLTLTYDPSRYSLSEAWRDLRRRFRSVVRFFKRHYGVVCALGVVEAHESLYPHLHVMLLLEKPAPVFYHRNLRRFSEKKAKWERALGREGFIDAVAPRNAKEVSRYLPSYLGKVSKELSEAGPEGVPESPKALTPFICRLFRVPMVFIYPRGFDKRLWKLTKPSKPTPKPPEEILLAYAIWSFKYRKPIEGIPWGTIDYWARVERYIRELYAQYHKVVTGSEPARWAYDLIKLSSIQSPPDWAFAGWLMGLLYSLFEATKEVVVLGFCSFSLGG